MKELFDHQEIARLLAISEHQVRYWDRIGLIPHRRKAKGRVLFDFKALVALRTVKELRDRGVCLRRIRRCLERVKKMLPHLEEPLAEVRFGLQGSELVVSRDRRAFTSEGQMLLDFSPGEEGTARQAVDPVETLFFQALEWEERRDWERARTKYQALLKVQPDHTDALVNLGKIMHRAGLTPEAEDCFRWALQTDPDHVEANYSLASVLEGQGDLINALLFYQKALYEDGEFAEAHLQLARVLDQLEERGRARQHWLAYLKLEPEGEGAADARRRLEET